MEKLHIEKKTLIDLINRKNLRKIMFKLTCMIGKKNYFPYLHLKLWNIKRNQDMINDF
jgi:hypothetical protein